MNLSKSRLQRLTEKLNAERGFTFTVSKSLQDGVELLL